MYMFCSICKDEFNPISEVKVTSCGHLYHSSCISRWTEERKTCPQCRSCLLSRPFRVYLNFDKDDNGKDACILEQEVGALLERIRISETVIKGLNADRDACLKLLEEMRTWGSTIKEKNHTLKTTQKALKDQVLLLSKQVKDVPRLQSEIELWKKKALSNERLELVLTGSADEIDKMLASATVSEFSVRQLCTYIGVLRTQMKKTEANVSELAETNKELLRSVAKEKQKTSEEVEKLKLVNHSLESELTRVKEILTRSLKKAAQKMESSPMMSNSQILDKKPTYTMDFDMIEASHEKIEKPKNNNSLISKWEDMVCAGPSGTTGKSLIRFRSICPGLSKEPSGNDSNYGFDGLGGRKKIRLGGPTPRDEFEKIKKKKNKEQVLGNKSKKIIEYYQIE